MVAAAIYRDGRFESIIAAVIGITLISVEIAAVIDAIGIAGIEGAIFVQVRIVGIGLDRQLMVVRHYQQYAGIHRGCQEQWRV